MSGKYQSSWNEHSIDYYVKRNIYCIYIVNYFQRRILTFNFCEWGKKLEKYPERIIAVFFYQNCQIDH